MDSLSYLRGGLVQTHRKEVPCTEHQFLSLYARPSRRAEHVAGNDVRRLCLQRKKQWRAHRDGRLLGGGRQRAHRPLLPDRRRRRRARPSGTLRPRDRHRDEPGHPFDPRARRIFLRHADHGQSQLAQERRALQAARRSRWRRRGRRHGRQGPANDFDRATAARRRAHPGAAAAPLSVPAGRSRDRVRAGQARARASRTSPSTSRSSRAISPAIR